MSEELPKLKPCPFCGSNEDIEQREAWVVTGYKWYVNCGDCWGHGPLRETKEDACASWNECLRSAERDALAAELSHLCPEWQALRDERDNLRERMQEANQYALGMEDNANELRAQLALVERYGADQWRRGNAGQEPQEFAEWRQETAAADRRAAFNGGEI